MENTTLLTVIGTDFTKADLTPAIETARAKNVHLAALVVGAIPPFPNYGVGMLPYGSAVIPDAWQDAVHKVTHDLKSKVDEIEHVLAAEAVSGDVTSLYAEPAGLADLVARRAKLCDLTTVSNSLRDDATTFSNLVHGLLFKSPAGVVVNGMETSAGLNAKHILIAWNTSLPAARTAKLALPLFKAAEKVTIVSFDPVMSEMSDGENPGSDLAKWLTHHGCSVTVEQHPSGGKDIATCILERTKEVGADLVVAGAYGHSRMREVIFGGTTQRLVEQRDMPVLLAH